MNGRNSAVRYCNVGRDRIVPADTVIGLFDLDSTTVKRDSRAFLKRAEERGEIEDLTTDLPVTFLLCDGVKGGQKVLLTSFSLPTLTARVKRRFP